MVVPLEPPKGQRLKKAEFLDSPIAGQTLSKVEFYDKQIEGAKGDVAEQAPREKRTLPRRGEVGPEEASTLKSDLLGVQAKKAALSQEGRDLKGAGLSRLLGDLGAAVSAKEPTSWQHGVSKYGASLGREKQMEALRAGKELPGLAGYGITDTDRQQLIGEALAGEEMSLKTRDVVSTEKRVGKIETPEQTRGREIERENVRGWWDLQAAMARQGAESRLQSVERIVDGDIQTFAFDRVTGHHYPTGLGGPRREPSAPRFSEDQRKNFAEKLLKDMERRSRGTKGEGFLGVFKGKVERKDVEEYINWKTNPQRLRTKGKKTGEVKPPRLKKATFDVLESPQMQPYLLAYDIAVNRKDVTAQFSEVNPQYRQQVMDIMKGLGIGSEQPSTATAEVEAESSAWLRGE